MLSLRGNITIIIKPPGIGQTTLLRLIMDIVWRTKMEFWVNDMIIFQHISWRHYEVHKISILFQSRTLLIVIGLSLTDIEFSLQPSFTRHLP